MNKNINKLQWAVVAKCSAKNDGVVEEWEQISALFPYPNLAQDYIDKVLPAENRDRFRIEHLSKL